MCRFHTRSAIGRRVLVAGLVVGVDSLAVSPFWWCWFVVVCGAMAANAVGSGDGDVSFFCCWCFCHFLVFCFVSEGYGSPFLCALSRAGCKQQRVDTLVVSLYDHQVRQQQGPGRGTADLRGAPRERPGGYRDDAVEHGRGSLLGQWAGDEKVQIWVLLL